MIEEYKQNIYLEKLYKKNTIDLNNYFKYSGKQEVGNKFIFLKFDYEIIIKDKIKIKNDMSKYKLKTL
jgi:hypothetical protein